MREKGIVPIGKFRVFVRKDGQEWVKIFSCAKQEQLEQWLEQNHSKLINDILVTEVKEFISKEESCTL